MLDSDQSYLLQSYNQNQPLFANVNLTRQSKKPTINYTPNYYPYENRQLKSKCRDDGGCADYACENEVGMEMYMLDSIDEDERQYDKSAGKANNFNTRDRRVRSTVQTKIRRNQNKYQQPSTNNKSIPKPILNTQWRTQHKQPTQQQKHLQTLTYLINKNKSQSQRKLTQLDKLLTQFHDNYRELVHKVQAYEQLLDKQSRVIEQQQYLIRQWSSQWEVLGRKIDTLQGCYEQVENYCGGLDMRAIREQIVRIIQQKLYSVYFHTNTNITEIGANQYNQPINSTKSVPIFTNFSSKQSQKYANNVHGNKEVSHYQSPNKQNIKQPIKYQQETTGIGTYEDSAQTILKQAQPIKSQPNQYCWQEHTHDNTQTYRKLTNIRIRQLENHNAMLENQLQSSNIKQMVIRQENKELREIVQGLIVEVQKLRKPRNGGRVGHGY